MLGRLFVPLAIGGGLMFLLISSASGQPTQKSSLDFLPPNLKQLVKTAQDSGDPAMLEQVAARLEAEGYREQPRLLRAQAAQIRQARGATPTASPGFTQMSPSEVPPFPSTAASSGPVLSPDLQRMVSEAIANGTAPVLTSAAFVLEKAGFPQVAEELRRRAKEAAASVPPPPAQDRPDVALDPSMPPELAKEVARQLQLQGDPNILEALAREMRARGFNNTADQLEAKAKQIRTALDAATTMHQIDHEIKTPGIAESPFSTGPSSTSTTSPPVTEIPITITASPSAQLPIPPSPLPQGAPAEKSKSQILAETVATSLNDLIDRFGDVRSAKRKEDQGLVRRFQGQEGLKTDGLYGPTTGLRVARYTSDVPPPFYWKKGAGQGDVDTYRSNMETLASDAEQVGNSDRAQRLRASAARATLV